MARGKQLDAITVMNRWMKSRFTCYIELYNTSGQEYSGQARIYVTHKDKRGYHMMLHTYNNKIHKAIWTLNEKGMKTRGLRLYFFANTLNPDISSYMNEND